MTIKERRHAIEERIRIANRELIDLQFECKHPDAQRYLEVNRYSSWTSTVCNDCCMSWTEDT